MAVTKATVWFDIRDIATVFQTEQEAQQHAEKLDLTEFITAQSHLDEFSAGRLARALTSKYKLIPK